MPRSNSHADSSIGKLGCPAPSWHHISTAGRLATPCPLWRRRRPAPDEAPWSRDRRTPILVRVVGHVLGLPAAGASHGFLIGREHAEVKSLPSGLPGCHGCPVALRPNPVDMLGE